MVSLGWQDSLVYRFNSLVWVAYAVVPSFALMLVWLAAYGDAGRSNIGGYDLSQMLTYYLVVTALSVAITPNPEWDIATTIRDGKITPFLLRPIGYFGYRVSWETSYQVVKTAMAAPAFLALGWFFRAYIHIPPPDAGRLACFLLACLGAYGLLSQLKFLLGISAFWVAEAGGLIEIWNVLCGLFAGRLLPLALLPAWAQSLGTLLPFSLLYAFPVSILMGRATPATLLAGFGGQLMWLLVLGALVRFGWQRGLRAYEAYGG